MDTASTDMHALTLTHCTPTHTHLDSSAASPSPALRYQAPPPHATLSPSFSNEQASQPPRAALPQATKTAAMSVKRTTPTRKPTPSHRRPRRAEPAAGSNDDVDGHEHEGAEPEINIDADAASRGTMPKPNSKHTPSPLHREPASPHHAPSCFVPRRDLRRALW